MKKLHFLFVVFLFLRITSTVQSGLITGTFCEPNQRNYTTKKQLKIEFYQTTLAVRIGAKLWLKNQ